METEKNYNEKCKICGNVKLSFICDITLIPDDQPYNDVDYQKPKTDISDAENYLDSHSITYCEYCKKFDDIEKTC